MFESFGFKEKGGWGVKLIINVPIKCMADK